MEVINSHSAYGIAQLREIYTPFNEKIYYFGGKFMINKIKNWIKTHRYITGACLLLASICAIAFGFAQFGQQERDDMDGPLADYLREDPEEITETDEW